jgi:hypothetical protein
MFTVNAARLFAARIRVICSCIGRPRTQRPCHNATTRDRYRGVSARKGVLMQLFDGLDADDSTYRALSLILEAWDEGTESGVPNEQMAYAALFTALTDLVSQFGEDAVVKLANGLERRIRIGEFTLHRTRQ